MFSIIFRRLQKFLSVVKLLFLIGSASIIAFIVFNIPPTIVTILVASLLVFVFLMTFLSVFSRTKTAFLVALSVAFILFLKAVELLNPLNIGLFALFVIFLGFYLYKQPTKKVDHGYNTGTP